MIKLIATDMDGTLLDEKGNLPKDFLINLFLNYNVFLIILIITHNANIMITPIMICSFILIILS